MANTINYAAVFNRILDEKFYIMPRTSWMENTNPGIQWTGGKEIKVPMLSMDGLGDMQGCQAPQGDMTLNWETKTLEYYRGRDFSIPRYDVDMTNFALTVENALRVFLNEHVIPELDKVRIARVAQAANSYGTGSVVSQATSGITPDNVLTLLLNDIATVQDKIGETEQLYVQISTKLKNVLMMSSQIQRYLNTRDFTIRSVTTLVESINEQFLIGTPSGYMKSSFLLNDGRTAGQLMGGVSFVETAPGINWIVASRRAVDAVARPQVTKVISPDENQMGDCWKIMFNMFHGIWTYQNKADGLLVNMDNTLGTLTVTSVAGPTAGATTIGANVESNADTILVYKTGSSAQTVTAGTALTGWAQLPAGGTITPESGSVITVAAVGATSLLPLASGSATIVTA